MDDSEFQEEQEPESLRRKWEKEEIESATSGKKMIDCPHCKQPIEADSFMCLYCGTRVFTNSGPMGRLAHAVKNGNGIWIVILILMGFMALSLLY